MILNVVRSPEVGRKYLGKHIFLAGGITGVEDWQSKIIERLTKANLRHEVTLYNPRRKEFDISDPTIGVEQIYWENKYLELCSSIIFYFSYETVQPITLFELGKFLESDKQIIIGIHPDYKRRLDVIIQSKIVRPDIIITNGFEDLVENSISLINESRL